jgi:dissimilatory sulfite reductase (desulfoviridin) alpha/beta subunit
MNLVSLSCCPNACSAPDRRFPGSSEANTESYRRGLYLCGVCLEACQEGAITLKEEEDFPTIDFEKCLSCGQCITACPTGTLQEDTQGFRVLVGGKLGRHPQLGKDLGKIYSKDEMIQLLNQYLDLYQSHTQKGERLGEILNRLERSDSP